VGFGICERLIDEFLTTRSLSAHLVVIPTTRSAKKALATASALRKYTKRVSKTHKGLASRAGPNYDPAETVKRVHILTVQLDLCNLASVHKAAQQLVHGTVSYPSDDSLARVRIPQLDSVIFNAGIGGWFGLAWAKIPGNFLRAGIVQATTWPEFKGSAGGLTINPLPDSPSDDTPRIGEVFCANLFGHYMFAHGLLPLLRRHPSDSRQPGRIIWESSIDAARHHLSLDDFQCLKDPAAYESSKRITDLLALTATLPAARPFAESYLRGDEGEKENAAGDEPATLPKIYLAQPGIVLTSLFPVNAFLYFWYRVVLYMARFLGSAWHVITPYKAACAMVWLALQSQEALDAASAEHVKWGSSTDRLGNTRVKKTEVDGWGWEGTVLDRATVRKITGRKLGAVAVTQEQKEEFEMTGAKCWREMEQLRKEWEAWVKAAIPNESE
jgi:3-keto steroid reductase